MAIQNWLDDDSWMLLSRTAHRPVTVVATRTGDVIATNQIQPEAPQ